jgi:ribA/ribD-fused uncharacterized protein
MFAKLPENSLFVSMADVLNPLSTYSKHPIESDGSEWPSVEHYFNAMKYVDAGYQEKIRQAEHPAKAHKLGNPWFRKKRGDWKKVRDTIMTRAVWIKCKTYPEVAQALLDTGDQPIVETSNFDYYWGCGRDTRGLNKYGKVLMAVRDRLREESAGNEPAPSEPASQ